jgi:hypothetical protein
MLGLCSIFLRAAPALATHLSCEEFRAKDGMQLTLFQSP